MGDPPNAALSINSSSGFESQMGTPVGRGPYVVSVTATPGSRNGRGNGDHAVELAIRCICLRRLVQRSVVWLAVVNELTATRIPSNCENLPYAARRREPSAATELQPAMDYRVESSVNVCGPSISVLVRRRRWIASSSSPHPAVHRNRGRQLRVDPV